MKSPTRPMLFLVLLLLCTNCRKPYQPAIISVNPNYLVVEGVINSGSDSTFITLSRTALLNSKSIPPETGATVTVESDKNDIYPLAEVKPGIYSVANLNLPTDRKY